MTAYASLQDFARIPVGSLGRGPIALMIAEDASELDSTLAHLGTLGFARRIVMAPDGLEVPQSGPSPVDRITHPTRQPGTTEAAVNHLIAKAPGAWLHYCYNGEYLFFPFSEDRTIGEATSFVEEERRASILTYVIDLYAADLTAHPDAVSRETAHLDRAGYYAETRRGPGGEIRERQLNFFGGLRWRFEEHVPAEKRKIDRVAVFKSQPGLQLRSDHTLSDEELNTFACPWHHSLTAAICSFRVAKALRTNPGSRHDIDSFVWHRSEPFEWSSRQLMDLGLIEPGQWF
ncbi:MAG: hypothetical protein AAF914_11850 [Pseudomonadota bacterium]